MLASLLQRGGQGGAAAPPSALPFETHARLELKYSSLARDKALNELVSVYIPSTNIASLVVKLAGVDLGARVMEDGLDDLRYLVLLARDHYVAKLTEFEQDQQDSRVKYASLAATDAAGFAKCENASQRHGAAAEAIARVALIHCGYGWSNPAVLRISISRYNEAMTYFNPLSVWIAQSPLIVTKDPSGGRRNTKLVTRKPKLKQHILVSVPHGACEFDSRQSRRCDRRAASAAAQLINAFKRRGIKAVTAVINNSVDRSTQIDMNRSVSRTSTDWRRNLSHEMETADWVIDVHSFNVGGFGGDKSVHIVLLDDSGSEEFTPLATAMHTYLKLRNPKLEIKLLRGVNNDIQDEARRHGCKSLLVEFCEDDTHLNQAQLQAVADTIADFVDTFANDQTENKE